MQAVRQKLVLLLLLVVIAIEAQADHSPNVLHTIDTSGLTDTELLCRLNFSANGGNVEECSQPGSPSAGPAPLVAGSNCECAPVWQCKDAPVVEPVSGNGGNFLNQINLRSNFGCTTPEEVCCVDIDPTLKPQITPFTPTCGKRNEEGIVTNFVGFKNRQSQFGEFPWMAAVMTSKKFGSSNLPLYICGASLVHRQVVLTAAHYIQQRKAEELAVRLGEWNFKEQSESVPHQEFLVREALIHPKYVPSILAYDVGLLILDRPAELGHTVDTICLPPPFYDFKGHQCVVSGWGKDMFSAAGKYQQILKSIALPAVDHAVCEAAMKTTRLGPGFRLDDSFMCAGGEEGIDACEGDGGSPLACYKPGDPSKYYQAGVVSWGIGCGDAGIPGVYADVSKAVPWIQEVIAAKFP